MSTNKTMVYKELDSRVYQLDPNQKADTVRQTLTDSGYIPNDTDNEAWRFYIYQSKSTNFSDAILGKEVEPLVPISGMFGPGSQLYLTNILTTKRPDLMGIGCDWFFDRYMACKVTLNNDEASAKAANAGKFEPMMMCHVRPTSKNVAGIYDNVVVCEQGSVISIDVSSWGAAGFGFSIKPDAGESIADGLYVVYGDTPDHYAQTGLRRYESEAKQIVIDSTATMNIPSGQSVQYQRISVTTWRIGSYESGGHKYSSDTQPHGPTGGEFYSGRRATSRSAEDDTNRQLANGEVVPGSSINPGTPHPGDSSNQSFGGISNVKDDYPTALGQVLIYFFVFNSHEDAVKVIDQINSPNPNVWA